MLENKSWEIRTAQLKTVHTAVVLAVVRFSFLHTVCLILKRKHVERHYVTMHALLSEASELASTDFEPGYK